MSERSLPFYLQRPELHLRPVSEFQKLSFFFAKPEYVEDPNQTLKPDYLYIARKGRIGILHWYTVDGLFGRKEKYKRIVPCKYDEVEKHADHFIGRKGGKAVYYDLKGNILK